MIARVQDGGFLVIDKEKIPVKLGEGGINNNVIAHNPFQRGLKAMKTHKATIDRFEVDKTLAFATSAIRSAENGKDFVKKVKAETGIEIEVISGNREAELIYYGVRQALDLGDEKVLIMDIGGGSTEFIIADRNRMYWKHSFDLGAARLLEVINPSEPISKNEIKKLRAYLKEQMQILWAACELYPVKTLVGSSGSFDSLAEMIYYRFHTEENPLVKTEYYFNLDHFEAIYKLIINSTIEKRFKMKGLAAMRVEMIVVAVIMIKYVMKKIKLNKMRLSTYSLKEGILFDYLESEKESETNG
jgi:exopolyphosphatase/guanosine-5'-triphosphate,3'-diphosphate pyrophosphatase